MLVLSTKEDDGSSYGGWWMSPTVNGVSRLVLLNGFVGRFESDGQFSTRWAFDVGFAS